MGRWSIACAAFSMIAWWWWRRRRARTSSHRGGGNSQMYICFWYRLILCTLKRGNNSWYVSFGVQSWLLHIQSEHAEETTITMIDIFFWHLPGNLNINYQKISNYHVCMYFDSREKYSRGPNKSEQKMHDFKKISNLIRLKNACSWDFFCVNNAYGHTY